MRDLHRPRRGDPIVGGDSQELHADIPFDGAREVRHEQKAALENAHQGERLSPVHLGNLTSQLANSLCESILTNENVELMG
jgi:hypothetical protein